MAQLSSFETRIGRSEALIVTLVRASDYASRQGHSVVALEHLLLALTEDADAARVLVANSVDLDRLRNDVANFLGQQQPTAPPGSHPVDDPALVKILAYAEAAARQSPRPDVHIDGAIVLAAIVGDGKSMAATFLKAQGLTFQAAIRVIRQNAAAPASAPAPSAAPAATEDVQASPPTAPAESASPPKQVTTDAALAGSRSPPAQKPLFEPMGIPNIRPNPPPPPPAPPPRRVEAPAPPAAPPPEPPVPEPSPEIAREEADRGPAGPDPGYATSAQPPTIRPSPASPATESFARDDRERAVRRPPPAPPTPRPPPLPSADAGRRVPEGPPPIPPRHPGVEGGYTPAPPPQPGLGAARPPPPRPNLRLPPSGQGEPQLTTPWPEAEEQRPLPPPPQAPPHAPHRAPPGRGTAVPHKASERGRAQEAPQRGGRGAPRASVEAGQLVENIPRRMKVGVVETVEIRIGREGVAMSGGLPGGGAPQLHQLLITRAMSVRLQGEPGRFYIEPKSPETQWTGSRADQLASDYAVWRFTVIPQVRGAADLTLIVASRSIGADGVIADTSLPEQRISIRVSSNFTRGFRRWIGWIFIAVLGGVLSQLGERFWEQLWALARATLAI